MPLLRKQLPQPRRARSRACSGSRSSPTPTTCASRRRFPIVTRLVAAGASVRIHDPVVTALPEELASEPRVDLSADLAEHRSHDADAVVLVTRWDGVRRLAELFESRASTRWSSTAAGCSTRTASLATRASAWAARLRLLRRRAEALPPRARRGSAGPQGCVRSRSVDYAGSARCVGRYRVLHTIEGSETSPRVVVRSIRHRAVAYGEPRS